MFQKDPGHWPMWTWARTLGIPWTKGGQAWYVGSLRLLGASLLPYLSSLGSNTNFTSLTIAGKYFSAAPCKPRREKNVGHHAVWQMWIQSCDHYEEAEAHQEGNTFQMRSWWLSTTKIEGVTKSLWSTNNGDVICLSWRIIITAALAKASTLCLLTECLRNEIWKLVAQLCPTFCDPHGLQPVRLLCPWNSPSKSTGVGCQWMPILR